MALCFIVLRNKRRVIKKFKSEINIKKDEKNMKENLTGFLLGNVGAVRADSVENPHRARHSLECIIKSVVVVTSRIQSMAQHLVIVHT